MSEITYCLTVIELVLGRNEMGAHDTLNLYRLVLCNHQRSEQSSLVSDFLKFQGDTINQLSYTNLLTEDSVTELSYQLNWLIHGLFQLYYYLSREYIKIILQNYNSYIFLDDD